MQRTRPHAPLLTLATLTALGLAAARPATAQSIDNTAQWNGTDYVSIFGNPTTATYGQTITPGAGQTSLKDFTFYLGHYDGTAPTFSAYVAAWDGSEITGPLLYSSPSTVGPSGSGFTAYTFDTSGVTLTQGQQYALFLSTTDYFDATDLQLDKLGATPADSYAGGAFIYDDSRNNFNALYSTWAQTGTTTKNYGSGRDLAFKADFDPATPAPEPSTLAAFAFTALGALALTLRARKRRPA